MNEVTCARDLYFKFEGILIFAPIDFLHGFGGGGGSTGTWDETLYAGRILRLISLKLNLLFAI